MQHQSLLERVAASLSINPADLGDGATNGTSVDMQGWDGVVFMAVVGNITDTVDLKAQGSSDNSSFADIAAGAAITQVANTGDNKLYCLDVWRPTQRYVRPVVTAGGTGATIIVGVVALRYRRTGLLPLTQDATVGQLVKYAAN